MEREGGTFELQNGDLAIRGGAAKDESKFVRGKADGINRGIVGAVLLEDPKGAIGCAASALK